jgi:hypothetical protein
VRAAYARPEDLDDREGKINFLVTMPDGTSMLVFSTHVVLDEKPA